MYRTSDGKCEFFTSNSVRSASSREGGGSLGCRVGHSFLIRRILQIKTPEGQNDISSVLAASCTRAEHNTKIPQAEHNTKSTLYQVTHYQIDKTAVFLSLTAPFLPSSAKLQTMLQAHPLHFNKLPSRMQGQCPAGRPKDCEKQQQQKNTVLGIGSTPHTHRQNKTPPHTTPHTQQHPLHEFSPSLKPKYLFAKFKTFARFRILWRGTVFPTREFGRVVTQEEVTKPETFTKKHAKDLSHLPGHQNMSRARQ